MAAELTDEQIDPVAEQFFSTLNGLTPMQWRGFARAILAKATQGAEPVGTLYVSKFRGHLENSSFDYTGTLPDGTYPLYTAPPPTAEVEKKAARYDWLNKKMHLGLHGPDSQLMKWLQYHCISAYSAMYEMDAYIDAALQSDQAQAGKGE